MRRLAILALLLALCGTTCQQGGETSALLLAPLEQTVAPGTIITLEVFASVPASALQAFALDVRSSPPILIPFEIVPHAEFDDDGKLFRAPDFDVFQGLASGAVDLRHGGGVSGTFRIATVRLYAMSSGTATVSVAGSVLATPSGGLVSAALYGSQITVTSP